MSGMGHASGMNSGMNSGMGGGLNSSGQGEGLPFDAPSIPPLPLGFGDPSSLALEMLTSSSAAHGAHGSITPSQLSPSAFSLSPVLGMDFGGLQPSLGAGAGAGAGGASTAAMVSYSLRGERERECVCVCVSFFLLCVCVCVL